MTAEQPAGMDEREDRQMIELLNELRVALPGIQMLFAFLLIVPFSDGFDAATTFQRDVYFATLLSGAVAVGFLVAPSAAHRVLFHRGQRPWLVEHAHRMLIGGLAFLGLTLVGAVLMISDFLFGVPAAVIFPPLVGVFLAGLWFAVPLARR